MPRRPRAIEGGLVHHVLNRANGGATLFRSESEFAAFERVLAEAHRHHPVRILAYCVMPNHWHLALWPRVGEESELSDFMAWLTKTHSQRLHVDRGTVGSGHVYQGRFKAFPVQTDEHLWAVLRYVERNPLRAGLVGRAEDWRWSSLWRRLHTPDDPLLSAWPGGRPSNWLRWVNDPQTTSEMEAIRESIHRGRPFGDPAWSQHTAGRLGLDGTMRPPGRPAKTGPVPVFWAAP